MITPAATPFAAGHGLLRSVSTVSSRSSLPPDRRGRLRNGARPGDFLAAPRCGATLGSNHRGDVRISAIFNCVR
jgi:hypothetical protein